MKLKIITTNIFLTLIFIYIASFSFSIFEVFSISIKKNRDQKWLDNRKKEKILAVKEGYLPVFNPSIVAKIKDKTPPIYPIGSLPYTKTYLCNEGYGLITYLSDRFGLRNSDEKWVNINNQSNIFLIGDSYINGECVPKNATISSKIESSTKINTINLGMGGNSPYEYRATIKSIVSPIIKNSNKENKVVLFFYINDNILYDSSRELLLDSTKSILNSSLEEGFFPNDFYTENITNFIKNNYPFSKKEVIKEINKLILENNFVRNERNFKQSKFYRIVSLHPVRRRFGIINFTDSKISSSLQTSSQKAITLLSEICNNQCQPSIAYIPNSNFWHPMPNEKNYKEELKEISERKGVQFIDGEIVIDKNNLKDYGPEGPHLSIEGYAKMADLIIRKIFK